MWKHFRHRARSLFSSRPVTSSAPGYPVPARQPTARHLYSGGRALQLLQLQAWAQPGQSRHPSRLDWISNFRGSFPPCTFCHPTGRPPCPCSHNKARQTQFPHTLSPEGKEEGEQVINTARLPFCLPVETLHSWALPTLRRRSRRRTPLLPLLARAALCCAVRAVLRCAVLCFLRS